MSVYQTRCVIEFTGDDTDGSFDRFADRLTDALYDLEEAGVGIVNPDTGGSLTSRLLAITMGVEADTEADARRLASAHIRTALHVAGCDTPEWPTFKPTSDPSAELVPA